MKKLSALLLSMVMAVSLAVPAFADGADGPAPDDYDYGDAVPISAPIDDDIYGWTAEDEWESVCEIYPEKVAVFQTEVKTWFAQHADWYDADTFDEFVENVGGEEAAYVSLFYDWNMEREEALARDELIKALGGVPGQVNVRVNNEFVKFPDAAPEITNGRTMAPLRAIMEALGAEVAYNGNDDIRCTVNGVEYTFAVGSSAVHLRYVEYGGEGDAPDMEGIVMDCAPYIKGGRTYVPVRFFAEALGYEVGWDGEYRTATLLDREALAAEIDKDFTIMNRVQAANALALKEGESGQTKTKGSVSVTAFDTLNGNKTYQADFDSKMLANDQAVSGSFSLKLSDSMMDELIKNLISSNAPDEDIAGVRERLSLVLDVLENAELIMNKDGQMWVHSPALDQLGGVKDTWCGMDLDFSESQMVFAGTNAATVGTVLSSLAPTDSVVMSDEVSGAVMLLMELYSDDKFTTSGGVSTLTIDAEDLEMLFENLGMGGIQDEFKTFELTMKVDEKGGTTVTCEMETSAQFGTPAVKLSMTGAQSAGEAAFTVELHAANIGEFKLTVDVTQQATAGKPMTQPPEEANVVDAPELLES